MQKIALQEQSADVRCEAGVRLQDGQQHQGNSGFLRLQTPLQPSAGLTVDAQAAMDMARMQEGASRMHF